MALNQWIVEQSGVTETEQSGVDISSPSDKNPQHTGKKDMLVQTKGQKSLVVLQ